MTRQPVLREGGQAVRARAAAKAQQQTGREVVKVKEEEEEEEEEQESLREGRAVCARAAAEAR